MTMPSFEDFDALLDETTMASCGETIQYSPDGGTWSAQKAIVDYADQDLDTGNGIAIAQNIQVEMQKSAVAVKPNGQCRLVLTKRPGDTFKPVNVGTDKSGNCWAFALETVGG